MKGKRRTIEEKVRILRKADGDKTVLQVCDEHNISEQTFYRWKKEMGLMDTRPHSDGLTFRPFARSVGVPTG